VPVIRRIHALTLWAAFGSSILFPTKLSSPAPGFHLKSTTCIWFSYLKVTLGNWRWHKTGIGRWPALFKFKWYWARSLGYDRLAN